jgi:hypothetical protein
MTLLNPSELKEIMIDFNIDFLIDVHDFLKDRYHLTGLFQKSKSSDFIHTIFDHFYFEYDDETPDDDDDVEDITVL